MSDVPKVPKRIAAVIINSLKGGVVPRIGLPYVTVGREREIKALLHDLDLVADGGASFRFLVGRYGSGKSFLLQTIRTHAMGKGFVVADADLSPERRLQGGQGQGLATYRELIRNLSTKTRPEGGALQLVLDRWVMALSSPAGEGEPSERLAAQLAPVIHLEPLTYEELLVLIEKLADIHAGYFGYERTLTEAQLVDFLTIEFGRVGADSHLTPREVIRDFIELLDIVCQNPQADVDKLLRSDAFSSAVAAPAEATATSIGDVAAPFAEFTI